MKKRQNIIFSIVLSFLLMAILVVLIRHSESATHGRQYFRHEGKVFGTYYNIQYEGDSALQADIETAFVRFDNSLSMFNPQSIISRINRNEDTKTDEYFEQMWEEAQRVSRESGGAFDITIAPIVNLWGFGFMNREQITGEKVDSLLKLVGYEKITLRAHRIYKSDSCIMLDAGAVAKGQACDIIASLLREEGCSNYIVDIGGEVVAKGKNANGQPWRIGITKPKDDPMGQSKELEDIIESENICMATSGNYRNFYYEGNQRRSHTIDPRTGYPVQHNLLSATVVSTSCMRADALATACMVLGETKGMEMIEHCGDTECYFIVSQGDSTIVKTSRGWRYK